MDQRSDELRTRVCWTGGFVATVGKMTGILPRCLRDLAQVRGGAGSECTPRVCRSRGCKGMKRALVYSHDTFGLGNIRRMLAICEHLLECIPDLSILLITGSPMVHSFRLPQRLDYVKLPSITRPERERYAAKFLDIDMDDMIALRSSLILSTVVNFDP